RVVMDYLGRAGLTPYLDKLGFELVGFGCTTCIGNSGPLPAEVSAAIAAGGLSAVAVLSGNLNFEGRIHPEVRMNYLASPPLVVAYALAGTMDFDFASQPLGRRPSGEPVYLADLWPSPQEVAATISSFLDAEMYVRAYAGVFAGDSRWQSIEAPDTFAYQWDDTSTYVRRPPYVTPSSVGGPADIHGARALLVLGDSVTTDHISPAGTIPLQSPAGRWLTDHGVAPDELSSYGARRGNHEVMVRGTFANLRLRNRLAPGTEGGVTRHLPDGELGSVFEVALRYQSEGVPLVVLAGRDYGAGSSRDWAAKGVALLGVRAVLAESFERIHRSNLVGMGML
ncbi:MAG: aconitase family protein, partial [Acidimicrobiales bacterium]